MTFDDLAAGLAVFVDANCFLYYFTGHPVHGPACKKLLDRMENKEVEGYTSTHVLAEMVHRLMTIEASLVFGWPARGIAPRLRKHPAEVQQLIRSRQALDEIGLLKMDVLPTSLKQISLAVDFSRQTGLLCGDALVAAVMHDHGLPHLASHDADFDRLPGLSRYAPA